MQVIGIMAFLIIGGLAGNSLVAALAQPDVQDTIESAVPFIAGHLTTLTLVAGAILALIVVAIPPVVLNRDRANGEITGTFEKLGIAIAIAMGIASVGYLFGVGWVALTTAF